MAKKRRSTYRPAQQTRPAQDKKTEARRALDGFINTLAYLGEASELTQASDYQRHSITRDYELLTVMYRDNWVAKRGALFMETLRLKVQEMGGTVLHIKTDSIKVQEPTEEIKNFIISYGKEYGYTFEIEDIYERICLVNDAVYIALRDKNDPGWLD